MSRREDHQIRVHLIEARGLKGTANDSDLVNPVVKVSLEAGNVKKHQRSEIYSNVSSVFFDEHMIFQEDISRNEFQDGFVKILVEDDQGFFANNVIGETSFDLPSVHESPGHEFFNRWVPLQNPERRGEITGFLRLSVIVLRSGEVPKTHTKAELQADGTSSDDAAGGIASMLVGLPDIKLQPQQLCVRVYKAEISTSGLSRPDTYIRMSFPGTTPVKSGVVKSNFNPVFNDELNMPIYLPTNSDRIMLELIAKSDDNKVIAEYALSLKELRSEDMDPKWCNLYGIRPKPPSLQEQTRKVLELAGDARAKVPGQGDREPKILEPDSSFRARILVYATIEDLTGQKKVPKSQRLPMIIPKSQLEEIEPEDSEFTLRCDMYEGIGFPLGPLDALFMILEWGPRELKSNVCKPDNGKVIFESPRPSKQGYYELLDEIVVELPIFAEHHYDVFLHVYVQTPVGARRLGYKRYRTKQLLESNGWSTAPQWITFISDDPEDISMHTAMIQLALRFGTSKDIKKEAPKRPHVQIPKLNKYELAANIFQGRDMQPADENGLADPYVRISLAGVDRETQVIERTLQPIWYERVCIPLELPRNLTLAPKIVMLVYDSDPVFGVSLSSAVDPVIGIAICPPDPDDPLKPPRSLKEYLVRTGQPCNTKPEWIELFSPESAEALELHRAKPNDNPKPPSVGAILVSFELRPEQDAKKEDRRLREQAAAGQLLELANADDAAGGGAATSPRKGGGSAAESKDDQPEAADFAVQGSSGQGVMSKQINKHMSGNPMVQMLSSIAKPIPHMPRLVPCFMEVALVGVRDMRPRLVAGVAVEIGAPYIEFEYGHRSAPERFWKSGTAQANANDTGGGPNANFLELLYLQVALPEDPSYDPAMGVRVRDTARALAFLPGADSIVGSAMDPIVGVCTVPLKELMPSYERYEEERLAAEEAADEERVRLQAEEDERKMAEGERGNENTPEATNEEVLDELVFESTAKAKGEAGKPGRREAGTRSIAGPDTTEPELSTDSEDEDDDSEGEEGEDGEKKEKDPILTVPLEATLKDIPFTTRELHLGSNKPTVQLGKLAFGKKRTVGKLKMQVRIFEEEGFLERIKENPPPQLRKLFREQVIKVRVHVFWCTNLSSRADGKEPEPFLKVYNGTASHMQRTTRDKPVPRSLSPEFWTSFELTAVLPGQSQLHVEVWDYTILQEKLIGGTVIDLEDRLFSPDWQEKQKLGKLPRELRQLFNDGSSNAQGNVILRVEMLPLQFAKQNPMVALAPPAKEQFELRLIVWEARDVAMKDGGQSDVFVTVKPRGDTEYEKQSTDTHWFSTGEAEFNWRMIWPVFLPEAVPRLFIQVWDQDIIGADDAIGEAELNLKQMYTKVLAKKATQSLDKMWVPCTHPNFKGVQARICISIQIMTLQEAILFPAGRGRDAPNENPHLDPPVRPSLFDGLGLNFNLWNPFGMFKKYFLRCCCCLIIVAIIAVAVFLSTQGG